MGWIGLSATCLGVRRIAIALPTAEQAISSVICGNIEFIYDEGFLPNLADRLVDYLTGHPITFTCDLDLNGFTPFQTSVWRTTQSIPYGETRSYSWISKQIGSPGSVRAVGRALAVNPFPIIVPCHRVVCADGTMGGFSAGLEVKTRLLEMEGFCFRLPLFHLGVE